MKKLPSIALACLLSLITFNTCYAKKMIFKRVDVNVVSGTYTGKTGYALFSYDQDKATGVLAETIDGEKIVFNFLGQLITGKPQIILASGKFQNVAWVATAKNPQGLPFNFGFNSGFNRGQFGNKSEAFISNGENYFAYLQPNTFVDGAGTIKYSDVSISQRCDIPPLEIKLLIYPGATEVCWYREAGELSYEIGTYDRTSSSAGYMPGRLEGSSQGIKVDIDFEKLTQVKDHYFKSFDKSFANDLKIPGYKISYSSKGTYKDLRYTSYLLNSNEVQVRVNTSEWGMPLQTDPVKVINFIVKGLNTFDPKKLQRN